MRKALMEMAQNQSEAVAYNTKASKSRSDDRRETNSRMLKRDFNKSGISHTHSTKTGPDGSKHDHFDIGKHTKVISTHNSYKVLHKGKETHYQGDPEHRDNRNRVIDKVLHHIGQNESVMEMEQNQLDEAATVTHKFYSIKHWKNGDPKFDQLDRHLGNHEYKHSSLGNIAKTRPDHHIGIPKKATAAIRFMDKHAKGVNESVDEAATVTHKFYSIKHWKNGDSRFDKLDQHLGNHEYKHSSLGNIAKTRPDHHIGIPTKATSAIKFMDKHAKGVNESVERAAWVPESILDDDVSHFMGAAAAAKKAGKSHFNFGGKKYKVTMKSDAAKKIGESAECPTCRDGECQCEQPVQEAKISELSSKTLSSYIKKSAADAGSKAWDAGRGEHDKLGKSLGRLRGIEKATDKLAKRAKKNKSSKEESVEENYTDKQDASYRDEPTPKGAQKRLKALHKKALAYRKKHGVFPSVRKKQKAIAMKKGKSDLKFESVEEATKATAQHKPTAETSDTWDKQLATRKGEKEFIDKHEMDVALDAEKMYDQNKYEAMKKTPVRNGDKTDGDKKVVNPLSTDMVTGMRKALAQMKLSGE